MKVNKFVAVIVFVLIQSSSFGQEKFYLIQNPKVIPSYGVNGKFINFLNKEFSDLIKGKADSILLYYQVENDYNFAMIFWKKNQIGNATAYFQYNPPNQNVGKELIKSDTLKIISISGIYEIFRNERIRQIDTTIMYPNITPVYCQFYFNTKKMIKSGYRGTVDSQLPLDFLNAYAHEKNRILDRESAKDNTPQMKF